MSSVLCLPDKLIIDENFLVNPGLIHGRWDLRAQWQQTVMDTITTQVTHILEIESKADRVSRRELLILALALRRFNREISHWGLEKRNKWVLTKAREIVDRYHMRPISKGPPAIFHRKFQRLNQNLDVSHCKRCGREISSPESIERGLGSQCSRRI